MCARHDVRTSGAFARPVPNRTVKVSRKTGENRAGAGISRPHLALRGTTWHKIDPYIEILPRRVDIGLELARAQNTIPEFFHDGECIRVAGPINGPRRASSA